MPQPRIPRFVMPPLELPPPPPLPAPGAKIPATVAETICADLIQYMMEITLSLGRFGEAWEAHYTQYGRSAPPLYSHQKRQRAPRATPASDPGSATTTRPNVED